MPVLPSDPLPPRTVLTTPSRLRDAMGATVAAVDDDALERLIARATATAESFCGRRFARARLVETARGRPVRTMPLSLTPVVTIHTVSRDGVDLPPGNWRVDGAGVLTLAPVGRHPLVPRDLPGGDMPAESIAVDYTGGWVVPGNVDPPDLPPDLEAACHLLVRGEIDLRRRGSLGLASERLGDAARTYTAAPSPGLAHARALLNPYRRRVL